MATFHDITANQLREMIYLKERIEFLQGLLERVRGEGIVMKSASQKARRAKPKAAPTESTPVKITPRNW